MALTQLTSKEIPVKTSLGIAYLSAEIDRQVKAFAKVRDTLVKNYKIQVRAGGEADQITYTSTEVTPEEKEIAMKEFTDKINELIELEGEDDIKTRICLPENISVKPESLKPLLPFIEVR